MHKAYRSFLAFDLPEEMINELYGIILRQKRIFPDFKWVRRENIHLTLHFYGDLRLEQLNSLAAELAPLFREYHPPRVRLASSGAFPDLHNPRVLWVSLSGEVDRIKCLQKLTGECAAKNGLTLDTRPFLPHITLARLPKDKSNRVRDIALWPKEPIDKSKEFILTGITLYNSMLTPGGPVYTPFQRYLLGLKSQMIPTTDDSHNE